MDRIRCNQKLVLMIFVFVLMILQLSANAALAEKNSSNAVENKTSLDGNKENRFALMIGNGDYDFSPLKNPANDTKAMAGILHKLGFSVIEKYNLSQKEIKRAIDHFGKQLKDGGVGLFYYAGHGIQVQGQNYMIPVGANIVSEGDVEYEAVRVGRVLAKMADARNRLNIVILDACRDNPFQRSFRTAQRGLAYMHAPGGTLIAYATAPGFTASDGPGENSIYSGALIETLMIPGLKVEDVFKRVRSIVKNQTNDMQIPWESTSLLGDFYLHPKEEKDKPLEMAGGQVMVEYEEVKDSETGSLQIDSDPE